LRSLNVLCLGAVLFAGPSTVKASLILSESFNDITTLSASGWTITNNSTSGGDTSWFQGNPDVFSAQAGAANSYIAANFNNAAFGGDISNWLISPVLNLMDGEVLSFFTRTEESSVYPDAIEVRLSTNGSSSNVGATTTSTGDFTTLLLSINSLLTVGGYPSDWALETITLSGLGGPVSGRIAFRYAVTDTSSNADFIGIDTVSVSSSVAPEPGTVALMLAAGGVTFGTARWRGRKLTERKECS
jgi:hypothetical protein